MNPFAAEFARLARIGAILLGLFFVRVPAQAGGDIARRPGMSARSVAVGLLVATAFATAAYRLPRSAREVQARVEAAEQASRLDRELAPFRGIDFDPALLLRADALIPRDAAYYVDVGDELVVSHQVTRDAVFPLTAYWLLPRRRVTDLRAAEWIVSFGSDVGSLGVETQLVEDLGDGRRLLRVVG